MEEFAAIRFVQAVVVRMKVYPSCQVTEMLDRALCSCGDANVEKSAFAMVLLRFVNRGVCQESSSRAE